MSEANNMAGVMVTVHSKLQPEKLLMEALLNVGGSQDFAIEELEREATGVPCDRPGCISRHVLLLVKVRGALMLAMAVVHAEDRKRHHVRANSGVAPEAFRETLIATGRALWKADAAERIRARDQAVAARSAGLN